MLLQALNEIPMMREELQMLKMRAQMGGVCERGGGGAFRVEG